MWAFFNTALARTATSPALDSSQGCVATGSQVIADPGFEDSPSPWQTGIGGSVGVNDSSNAYSGVGYG